MHIFPRGVSRQSLSPGQGRPYETRAGGGQHQIRRDILLWGEYACAVMALMLGVISTVVFHDELLELAESLTSLGNERATQATFMPQLSERVPQPEASMSVQEVSRTVLGALASPDEPFPGAGAETLANFAGPRGPRHGRLSMVVACLLSDSSTEFELTDHTVEEGRAIQYVSLKRDGRITTGLAILLRRQTTGPLQGCWLVEEIGESSPVSTGAAER